MAAEDYINFDDWPDEDDDDVNVPGCPYCGKPSDLLNGAEVYPHRPDLADRKFWVCKPCDARVGCHGKGIRPLGTLANAELRGLRRNAHRVFDMLWANREHRLKLYEQARKDLGLEDDLHIGEADEELCRRVIEWAESKL